MDVERAALWAGMPGRFAFVEGEGYGGEVEEAGEEETAWAGADYGDCGVGGSGGGHAECLLGCSLVD